MKRVMDLKMPVRAIIAVIQRRNRVIIPNGDTQIHSGDTLIVFTRAENVPEIKKFFKVK